MDEQEITSQRHRGRPPKHQESAIPPDAEASDFVREAQGHEQTIRSKAVSLKLMDEFTANTMPFSEVEAMVKEAEGEGLGKEAKPLKGDVIDQAVEIIRGLLAPLQVMNANAMPMGDRCKVCSGMPEYVARDCACRKARMFLAQYAKQPAPAAVPNL